MLGDSHRPSTFGYLRPAEQYDVVLSPGGVVTNCVADTNQTLLIGDVVYYSSGAATATKKVSKSTTVGNYTQLLAGVVVGGYQTYGNILSGDADIGVVTAAAAGEGVIVQTAGIAKCLADGTISAMGDVIAGATTAGRIASGTTAGGVLGIALNTATVGLPVYVDIRRR